MLSSLFSILVNSLSLLIGALLCFSLHQCWLKYYPKLPPPPFPPPFELSLYPKPKPLEVKVFKGCYRRTYPPISSLWPEPGELAFTVSSALGVDYHKGPSGMPAQYSDFGLALPFDTSISIHSQ